MHQAHVLRYGTYPAPPLIASPAVTITRVRRPRPQARPHPAVRSVRQDRSLAGSARAVHQSAHWNSRRNSRFPAIRLAYAQGTGSVVPAHRKVWAVAGNAERSVGPKASIDAASSGSGARRSRDEFGPECVPPFLRKDRTIKPWDHTASARLFPPDPAKSSHQAQAGNADHGWRDV